MVFLAPSTDGVFIFREPEFIYPCIVCLKIKLEPWGSAAQESKEIKIIEGGTT